MIAEHVEAVKPFASGVTLPLCVAVIALALMIEAILIPDLRGLKADIVVLVVIGLVELGQFAWLKSVPSFPRWGQIVLVGVVLTSAVWVTARVRWEHSGHWSVVCQGARVKLRNDERIHVTTSPCTVTYVTSPLEACFRTYWEDPAFLWRDPK